MVLSSSSVGSTPSNALDALDLHSQFEGTTMGFQNDIAAFDVTLLLEDSFLSAVTDSGVSHPPTTTTSTLGPIHLSNQDFLEEKYHASRGKFDNEIAA